MKYDFDHFIKKFEDIPEDKWTTRTYHHEGKSCALGHCGEGFRSQIGGDILQDTNESQHLSRLFNKSPDATFSDIVGVNDGRLAEHLALGQTPKQRILKVLRALREFYS